MSIELKDISKSFGDFTALEDVSLEVPEGSLTALLGPSGSGKSTLLRIIAGLELPDSGSVEIDGADLGNVRPQKRGIGFVFQHYAAFTHMTVRENVAFGLADPQASARRGARARRRAAGARRADQVGRAAAGAAVRRAAPADGARAGARGPAARTAARRAVRRAGRDRPRRASGVAAPPARRAACDDRARDPRSGGGDGGRRPDRGDELRRDRAGRIAARDLRPPGERVRDGLRRAGEQGSASGSCARTTWRSRSRSSPTASRRWSGA